MPGTSHNGYHLKSNTKQAQQTAEPVFMLINIATLILSKND